MKRILPVIFALLLAGAAFANGLGGERLEKVVGDYIVDIGTDQTSTPVAGEPIEFDFNLLQSDSREPIGLATNIGIDIAHNGKSTLNCDLITEEPNTFLFYSFPEGGTFTLKVTFFDTKRSPPQLATASFPLKISGARNRLGLLYPAAGLACVLLGLLSGYWVARKRVAG
jgi:hypothetical protein